MSYSNNLLLLYFYHHPANIDVLVDCGWKLLPFERLTGIWSFSHTARKTLGSIKIMKIVAS